MWLDAAMDGTALDEDACGFLAHGWLAITAPRTENPPARQTPRADQQLRPDRAPACEGFELDLLELVPDVLSSHVGPIRCSVLACRSRDSPPSARRAPQPCSTAGSTLVHAALRSSSRSSPSERTG